MKFLVYDMMNQSVSRTPNTIMIKAETNDMDPEKTSDFIIKS